jgi:hypothetical protein
VPPDHPEGGAEGELYSEHRTSNIEQPTSNEQKPGKATQSRISAKAEKLKS